MLYVHYTKLDTNLVKLVKLVFSSYPDKIKVANKDWPTLQKIVLALKQIPVAERHMEKTHDKYVWTITEDKFKTLSSMWLIANWIYIHGLREWDIHDFNLLIEDKISSIKDTTATAPSAEEFFYSHTQTTSTPELPLEQLKLKLLELLDSPTIDKSSYRKAALRYHPDRNNGDGSKMSELNYLYQQYLEITGT